MQPSADAAACASTISAGRRDMEKVFSLDAVPWLDVRGLPGARGFEFKPLTNDEYTNAYSCELIRLGPSDHSVPHVEPWNHLLYILSGTGDIVIDGRA